MKKVTVILASLLMMCVGISAQTTTPTEAPTDITKVLEFKNETYNFGKIPFGKAVNYEVEVKNIGKDSIKIENVQVGCGCTTPKWQPGPYAPGQTFKVELGFNGATKGAFEKTVTFYFNGGLTKLVRFSGETFEVPADAAPAGPAQKLKPAGK